MAPPPPPPVLCGGLRQGITRRLRWVRGSGQSASSSSIGFRRATFLSSDGSVPPGYWPGLPLPQRVCGRCRRWLRRLLVVAVVEAERATDDVADRVVTLAVVRAVLAVISVAGIRKRHRAAGTSHEQARRHEACRRGDTHTRSHSVTTSHHAVRTLLTSATIVAQSGRTRLLVDGTAPVPGRATGGRSAGDSVVLRHRRHECPKCRRDDRKAAGMGLFTRRKSRATRRAEARAIKAKAKLEAKLAAKNENRRIKAAHRAETKALKAQLRAQRDSDRTALKVAETELKAAREGKLLSPTRIRRALTVTRLLAPIVVPLAYRAAMAARGFLDERRADRLGVPLSQLGQFSGHGAQLSARIAGAEQSLRQVAEKKPKDAETKQFVAAMTERLTDLSAAVTAAENMPTAQSPRRPRRDQPAARRHRRRPDGPPRRGLTPHRASRADDHRSALRGIAAGLLTAALAVAAHGVADGAAPSGTAVALLAVLAATVGGLATTISRAADVRVLLGLLAAGQLVGHLMLSCRRPQPRRADVARAGHARRARAGGGRRRGPDRRRRPALPCGVAGREGRDARRRRSRSRPGRPSSPAPISRCVPRCSSPRRCHTGVRRSAAPADRPNPDDKKVTIECIPHPGRPRAPSSPLPRTGAALSIGLRSPVPRPHGPMSTSTPTTPHRAPPRW